MYGASAIRLREWDQRDIEHHALGALSKTLAWALATVPIYEHARALAGEALEEDPLAVLAKLPVLSKADYKSNLESYLSTRMPVASRLRMYTGGSTAEPMMFYLQKGVTRSREYAFMEDFRARAGIREDDLVLTLRGHNVPSAARPGGKLWMYEPIKRQLIVSSDHLAPRYMRNYEDVLRRFRPRYVEAYPSAIYALSLWLHHHPIPEFTDQVRGVLLYSENVYDHQLRLIREIFGCPVLRHYGHSERVIMAGTLPDDDRYYFWPQYGYFELLSPSGAPITKPGQLGEIVGTSFDNLVMPFVRYRTGDMAFLSDRPSKLPGYPVVERIEGRLQEFVITRDYRLISVCSMGAAHFRDLSFLDAIQYEQREPGHLVLKYVSSRPLDESERRKIRVAVEEKTQHGCAVDLIQVNSIPRTRRGKQIMMVQHVDIERHLQVMQAAVM